MSEIAAALGYPQSSTTVLLKTLITLGYLNFDRRERLYFPTVKVTSLATGTARALRSAVSSRRCATSMRRPARRFRSTPRTISTCNMCRSCSPVHALRFHVDEGAMRLLTQSAVGWLLMSTMPDDKIDNVIRRANIATSKAADRVKVADMMEKIRSIRQQGYCSVENIPFLGGGTICVCCRDNPGTTVVLGLGGALERIRQNHDRYLSVLQKAAKTVVPSDPFDHRSRSSSEQDSSHR